MRLNIIEITHEMDGQWSTRFRSHKAREAREPEEGQNLGVWFYEEQD